MNKFLAIEFETGSGAIEVADRLSKALSIPCFCRDILKRVAEEHNLSREELRDFLYSMTDGLLYPCYIIHQVKNNASASLTKEGQIFISGQNAVRQFASQGSAIFVGNCAAEIVREYGNTKTAFITASGEDKSKRLSERLDSSELDADSIIRRLDGAKEQYYFCSTGKRWRDRENYDIVLNTSELGIESCVDALKKLYLQNEDYEEILA